MNPLYEHIFRTYDQDNSGHIDFAEFIQVGAVSWLDPLELQTHIPESMYHYLLFIHGWHHIIHPIQVSYCMETWFIRV